MPDQTTRTLAADAQWAADELYVSHAIRIALRKENEDLRDQIERQAATLAKFEADVVELRKANARLRASLAAHLHEMGRE